MRVSPIVVAAILTAAACHSMAITINYSNLPGTPADPNAIKFTGTGDTFEFIPTGGPHFQITSTIGGIDPDTIGLEGSMTGMWTIGPIVGVAPGPQSAPVTGTGTLSIVDEGGNVFSGDLVWDTIFTVGAGGTINPMASLNVTGITYPGGVNDDLLALAAPGSVVNVATFQFATPTGLSDLTADGTTHETSYSGSLTTKVPEGGSTLILLALALIGVGSAKAARRRG